MLAFALFFLGAGLAMAYDLFTGQAQFTHGPRTGHVLVTILGENLFSLVAMLVCLGLGGLGVFGLWSSISLNRLLAEAPDSAPPDSTPSARGSAGRERAPGPRVDEAREERRRRARARGAVLLECPHCGEASRIPERYAGKKGLCPKCQGRVRVPSA